VANHASALKRHRQSEKRRRRNQAIRSRLRHLVRAVREALGARDASTAASRLLDATRALNKAATKGIVHRRNASRRIARLTHAVGQLKTGS
jgi:small subunit ribosomal protein S20